MVAKEGMVMRRIVAIAGVSGALGAVVGVAVVIWRRNPRIGTTFVNSIVNPVLLRRGLAGGRTSEIGTLEHVGRRSGVRRLTPVHPEPTPEGFRIVVPLGTHSEWARNVQAAGHCRLQLHDVVYDLDEPNLILASDADALPFVVRRLMAALGFQYLELRTFAAIQGTLEPVEADAVAPGQLAAPGKLAAPEPERAAALPA
jgi:deazaflavin-dependent oxidoreductase (nitroreductase family)